MITVFFLFGALVVGLIVVLFVANNSKKNARPGQSSEAEAVKQAQMHNPRGDSRTTDGLD